FECESLVDMLQRATGRHEQVPQARVTRLGLQVLDQLQRLPAIAGIDLFLIVRDSGADVLVDELADAVAEKRLAFRKVKIHRQPLPCADPLAGSNTALGLSPARGKIDGRSRAIPRRNPR